MANPLNTEGRHARWAAMAAGVDVPTLAERLQRPTWQQWGRCRGTDVDQFFTGHVDVVKPLCAACPVAGDCLTFALGDKSLAGTWAGTTEADRRAIRAGRITAADWLAELEHRDAA